MAASSWTKRFLTSTRGRILALLRRGCGTVNELAEATGLTDNAVRAQLGALERDGFAEPAGTRPGSRKPNLVYRLAPGAGQVFPKCYGPLLQQVLAVLAEHLPAEEVEAVLRTVGSRVAGAYRPGIPPGGVRERLRHALSVLEELGGLASLEEQDGRLFIRGFDCPLAAAVAGHRAACRLAETLLSELIGCPVTERCVVGDVPACRFEVHAGPAGTA